MFLVTSVTMLRERTTGTLERLMTLPMRRADLVVGYALAFAVVAAAQALVATGFAVGLLGLDVAGSTAGSSGSPSSTPSSGWRSAWALVVRDDRVPGRAVHARVHPPPVPALRPARPASAMSPALDALAGILPMTYAYEALADVAAGDASGAAAAAAVTFGFCLAALVLGTLTLRRRTP